MYSTEKIDNSKSNWCEIQIQKKGDRKVIFNLLIAYRVLIVERVKGFYE
jgi:hypothetical protein